MRARSLPLLCGLLLVSGAARAQMLPPDESLLQLGRYEAVRERVVPGYERAGIPLGGFTLRPSLELAGQYNDNIYTLPTAKVGDAFVRLAPSVQLQSNWARRSLTVTANTQIDRYARHSSENQEETDLSAYAIQELGANTRVRLIGRFHDGRESRESQNAFALTERPVRYRTATGALGLSHRFASVLLSGEAGLTHADYRDARLAGGGPLDQDYRDSNLKRARARAEILQSPALAYFAQATYDWTDYRLRSATGLDRDSRAYELLGGVRFETPALMRGELGVGYVHADYRGAQFRSFSGLAINSRLLLFPSPLTTVTLTAKRSVQDAGIIESSGYVVLNGGVRVDHELLRSLVLSASAELERDSFNGIDRSDRRLSFGARADYKLNRNLSLQLAFDRLDLSSSGVDRYKTFTRNRALLGVGLGL